MVVLSTRAETIAVLFSAVLLALQATPASAYDLGGWTCGHLYGALRLEFSSDIKSYEDIARRLKEFPSADKPYPDFWFGGRATMLSDQLKNAWSDMQIGRSLGNIQVPVGSEEYIAQKLFDLRIIDKARHELGACGGAEVSYFSLNKSSSVPDLNDGLRFADFLRTILFKYIFSHGGKGYLEDGPLNIAPIPPRYSIKRFTAALPSSTSRGPQAGSTWDKFDIVFALWSQTDKEYNVAVHIENLKVAPKTALRDTPPSAEHFREFPQHDDYQPEMVAATSVARFFAGSSSKCEVEGEDFSSKTDSPFKCR